MNKKIIIAITVVIVGLAFIFAMSLFGEYIVKDKPEIKTNKETIYKLFNNFPESNNIYFYSESLYSERSVGPTIYQVDILAELTDDAYSEFINQVELEELDNYKIKINPNNIDYHWKNIKNYNIIESTNFEAATIESIYLDENTKTIYAIAIGGN